MKPELKKRGIKLILERYRNTFRIPENLNHYAPDDLKIAERKFLKYVMRIGQLEMRSHSQKAY